MDQPLLRAILAEARTRLLEQAIHRVSFLGAWRYLLRFASPDHDNLLVSVRPDLPRLHLMPRAGGLREAPPDRFAALADRELAGARLAAIDLAADDRVARFEFLAEAPGGARTTRYLVAEILGRSANALLLDQAGLVLGFARQLHSAFRAPETGRPYTPPVRSPVGETEQAPQTATPEGLWGVLSAKPLDEYREGDRPVRDEIRPARATVPSPYPADRGGIPVVTPFPGPSAAAAAAYGLVERLRDFDDARTRHQTAVRRECARLQTLLGRLGQDMERARGADRHRRFGEALLAGLRAARVDRDHASVPDPEATDGATIEVPIDPALSLQDNAQRHFALWKKGKRGRAMIEARAAAVQARLCEWKALAPRAAAVASADDLEDLRGAMDALGLVHEAPRSKRSARPAKDAPPTRVRRHVTRDGYTVLVGRSGPDNDTLTFRVASPWDIWMHAAGMPGAHVIVRNPSRLKNLPEATLRAAASIAAWYSGARGEGKVEVHYTERKHVHKRKGMPAGQVLVRRFRSIQVPPRLPQAAIEDI